MRLSWQHKVRRDYANVYIVRKRSVLIRVEAAMQIRKWKMHYYRLTLSVCKFVLISSF